MKHFDFSQEISKEFPRAILLAIALDNIQPDPCFGKTCVFLGRKSISIPL